jgi:diacylglycerol kinase
VICSELGQFGVEAILTTSFTKKDNVRAEETDERHHDRNLSTARPHIPFDWKVKAGRSGSLLESFYHAFNGLKSGFQTERNLRIHCLLAVCATALGIVLRIDALSWAAIVISIGVVLTAEFINTALEHLVDFVTEKTYHPAAKSAKDTAAAAVLIASFSALAVGCAIFAPRLLAFFK